MKSTVMAASSSPTRGAAKMAEGEIPELTDFFKQTTMTEDDRRAYHDRGWLTSNLVSFIPEVDVPTVEGSTIICFESELAVGLGLPPSKFLSSIMNYMGCSLVHLNPNSISAHQGYRQELLEGRPIEVDSCGHARPTLVGQQASVPSSYQESAD
jgi:hypothetical protein